jgi:glycosyltransferase involved in cell wall biosynthesis
MEREKDVSEASARGDLVAWYDAALREKYQNHRPSILFCVRTQLKRPALLTRTIQSIAAAQAMSIGLLDIHALIISDKEAETLETEVVRLQSLCPLLPLRGIATTIREKRYSRTDLLLQAVEQAKEDYIWFVDDDDFIYPHSIATVARYLPSGGGVMLTGSALRIDETWGNSEDVSVWTPSKAKRHSRLHGCDVYKLFSGDNYVHLSATIYPVRILQEQLAPMDMLGDYYEDYYLSLLTLSAPQAEVIPLDTLLSGYSIRGADNTVTETDRSHWNFSCATFLGEFLDKPHTGSPILWGLYNYVAPLHPWHPSMWGPEGRLPFFARLGMYVHYVWRIIRRMVLFPEDVPFLLQRAKDIYRHHGLRATISRAIGWVNR